MKNIMLQPELTQATGVRFIVNACVTVRKK